VEIIFEPEKKECQVKKGLKGLGNLRGFAWDLHPDIYPGLSWAGELYQRKSTKKKGGIKKGTGSEFREFGARPL
jgi:hypothetical protein